MKELVGDITSPRMPFQVGYFEILFANSDQSGSFQTEERKEQLERIKKYFKQDLRTHGSKISLERLSDIADDLSL